MKIKERKVGDSHADTMILTADLLSFWKRRTRQKTKLNNKSVIDHLPIFGITFSLSIAWKALPSEVSRRYSISQPVLSNIYCGMRIGCIHSS